MFSKFNLIAMVTLAVLAVACPMKPKATPSSDNNQCQTGSQHCCESVQQASSPSAQNLLGSIGAIISPNTNIGLTCTPITVIGTGSNSCSQQPVCCTGNNFNGAVVIGCTPINVSL